MLAERKFNEGSITTTILSRAHVGTLLIDLYDPARQQLVWRGDGTKTIDLTKYPDKSYRTLQKSMAKLFKNYPPRAGK